MTDTATPTREWLETGRAFNEKAAREDHRHNRTADQFQEAINTEIDALTWHDVPADGVITGPMSPVLMLKEVIGQLGLRPVVAYAYGGCLEHPDGPETATYSLLGVEIRTTRQRFRLHLLDTGTGAIPVCVDHLEGQR